MLRHSTETVVTRYLTSSALRAAEEASDVLQVVRIRPIEAPTSWRSGSYAEALQELDVAVRLAELTSFAELFSP